MRWIIGLTGGIATGKSTVARYLKTHHSIPILDADEFAREAVAAGSPILEAIAQRYGGEILQPNGSLDRAKLAEIVFDRADERRWLEEQIHPFVRQRFEQQTQHLSEEHLLVHAIPLLFEVGLVQTVSEVWVVTCTPAQQLTRLMARNQLSETQAKIRIRAQMPLTEKIARADVILDNSGSLMDLYRVVDGAVNRAIARAAVRY